jgi:DNA-binding NarL/FixJ family response regulator
MTGRPVAATLGPMPTLLLVDDHEPFRRAAREELEHGGFEVVGEAGDCAAVVPMATALRPDVVLLDIRLPDGDGVTVAADLAAALPEATVVLTSSMPAADAMERLSAAASSAPYLPKAGLSAAALHNIVDT